jgi:hypothetical protein
MARFGCVERNELCDALPAPRDRYLFALLNSIKKRRELVLSFENADVGHAFKLAEWLAD